MMLAHHGAMSTPSGSADPRRDYTTATVLGTTANIAITPYQLTYTGFDRNNDVRLTWDDGVGFWNGDITVDVDHYSNSSSDTNGICTIVDLSKNYTAGNVGSSPTPQDSIHLYIAATATNANIVLQEYDGGTRYSTTYLTSLDTDLYLRLRVVRGVGSFGTVYLDLYSDSARTSLTTTLSITLHSSVKDYRYVYAALSHHSGTTGNAFDGTTSNFIISQV